MRLIPIYNSPMLTLSELPKGQTAVIQAIQARDDVTVESDFIAQRLQDLGFIPGESIEITAHAPWGDPLIIAISGTQFALRRSEANRILVCIEEE